MSSRSSLASVHFDEPLTASQLSSRGSSKGGLRAKLGLQGVARRTLGISLLMVTVTLWTVSNFLASVSSPHDAFLWKDSAERLSNR
jgi:solute carrier family 35, member F5